MTRSPLRPQSVAWVVVVAVLCAATTAWSDDVPGWFWPLGPTGGDLLFVGFASRRAQRSDELALAVHDAAQQVSIYQAVRLRELSTYSTDSDGSAVDFVNNIDFDESLATTIAKELPILAQAEGQEGSYVLVSTGPLFPFPQSVPSLIPARGESSPSWVSEPPAISGFLTAVGVVQRRRLFGDSYRAADQVAITEIARQVRVKVSSGTIGVGAQGQSMQESLRKETVDVTLHGCYIAARWRSPDGRYFYSLAICPQGGVAP